MDDKKEAGGTNKTVVFGMLEEGGDIVTHVVADRRSGTLLPIIRQTVTKGAKVSTDEWLAYCGLGSKGYVHSRVNHSLDQYVCSKSGATVNAVGASGRS